MTRVTCVCLGVLGCAWVSRVTWMTRVTCVRGD